MERANRKASAAAIVAGLEKGRHRFRRQLAGRENARSDPAVETDHS